MTANVNFRHNAYAKCCPNSIQIFSFQTYLVFRPRYIIPPPEWRAGYKHAGLVITAGS